MSIYKPFAYRQALEKSSPCNKLAEASHKHSFGLKELGVSMWIQFWPVCRYD